MRHLIFSVIMIFIAGHSYGADRVIPTADLSYSGSFLPPETGYSYSSYPRLGWDYSYTPGRLIAGGDVTVSPPTIETLLLPTLVINHSFNYANLNRATVADAFHTITGSVDLNGGKFSDILYLPQQTGQDSAKYHWMVNLSYDVSGETVGRIGWSNADGTGASGLWRLDGLQSVEFALWNLEINNDWADTYAEGKYIGMGKVQQTDSKGPTLYAVAPWEDGSPPASEAPLDYIKLLGYDGTHRMETWSYGINHDAIDAAWVTIGGKQAYVVLWNAAWATNETDGTKWWTSVTPLTSVAYKDYCMNIQIGDSQLTESMDATQTTVPVTDSTVYPTSGELLVGSEKMSYTGKSGNNLTGVTRGIRGTTAATHTTAYRADLYNYPVMYYGNDDGGPNTVPNFPMLLFYDVDQIAEVAQSTRQPWDIQPYAYYDLSSYFFFSEARLQGQLDIAYNAVGMTYDPTGNRLIIKEIGQYNGDSRKPIFHVISLADVGSTLDTTAPPNVTGLSVSGEGVITFTPASGADNYVVYKEFHDICGPDLVEFRPIFATMVSTVTDTDYHAGDKYKVVSIDKSMNKSSGVSTASTSAGIKATGTAMGVKATGTAVSIRE